jgi:hypothetical protein
MEIIPCAESLLALIGSDSGQTIQSLSEEGVYGRSTGGLQSGELTGGLKGGRSRVREGEEEKLVSARCLYQIIQLQTSSVSL